MPDSGPGHVPEKYLTRSGMEFRGREYALDESRVLLQREPCASDPLLSGPIHSGEINGDGGGVKPVLDLNEEVDDPLRRNVPEFERNPSGDQNPVQLPERKARRRLDGDALEKAAAADWDAQKTAILQRFASAGSIAVTTSLDVVTRPGRGRLSASQRLEQLEDPVGGGREATRQVAVQEVVARLRELNADLSSAWVAAERLTALRLAIKVARLLRDTSVPSFYPTLFVLVTDCLDTVGALVWARIVRKAEDDAGARLPAGFTCRDIPPTAQETCRNWFHKVGAIPELLPRVYLELALVRCYHFLELTPPAAALARLSAMMRGITSPLAAAYAHLYLIRRTVAVAPSDIGPVLAGLRDRLAQFRAVQAGDHDASLHAAALSRGAYLQLLDPPLELTVRALFKDAAPEALPDLFAQLAPASAAPVGAMLAHLVAHLPGSFLATHALPLTRFIVATNDGSAKQAGLFCALGRKLALFPPPSDQHVAILNGTWKVVARYSDLEDYLAVADVMLDFVQRHFGFPELEVFLRDMARHVRVGGSPSAAALAHLEHLLAALFAAPPDLPQLLTLPQLASLVNAFQGDSRAAVARCILDAAVSWPTPLADRACLPLLLAAARALHDAVDLAAAPSERLAAARLLARFVHKMAPGWPAEQQLDFLGDCRAAFCNLDVQANLIHAALRLAVTCLRAGAPRDFVRACLVFCVVTLPAVGEPLQRTHLTLAVAEVALHAGLAYHAEAAVRVAIDSLPDLELTAVGESSWPASDAGLSSVLPRLANLLLLVPGPIDSGPLVLMHRLLAALETLPRFAMVQAACVLLPALAALAQTRPRPRVAAVSLSALYYGDAAFRADLATLAAAMTAAATSAAEANESGEQAGRSALQLCHVLLRVLQPGKELTHACARLLGVARKSLPSKDSELVMTALLVKDVT